MSDRTHGLDLERAFQELRPLMFSIAYRMVGSVSEAEDIVQDDGPARQRYLGRGRPGYQLDARLLRTMATDMLTIRIELDP